VSDELKEVEEGLGHEVATSVEVVKSGSLGKLDGVVLLEGGTLCGCILVEIEDARTLDDGAHVTFISLKLCV